MEMWLNGMRCLSVSVFFFFFNDTATTEIYTLPPPDALPPSPPGVARGGCALPARAPARWHGNTSVAACPCSTDVGVVGGRGLEEGGPVDLF